jgi:serine/threonine protein kinase
MSTDQLTGRRLGPYEVQSLLGAGGMGEVYRARDTRLGRDVAIKILPQAFASDPGGSGSSIWVADLGKGSAFQKVIDLPPDVRPRGATWTADGESLILGTAQRTSHLVVFDQGN